MVHQVNFPTKTNVKIKVRERPKKTLTPFMKTKQRIHLNSFLLYPGTDDTILFLFIYLSFQDRFSAPPHTNHER